MQVLSSFVFLDTTPSRTCIGLGISCVPGGVTRHRKTGSVASAGSAGTVEPEHVDHVGMVPADRRLIKFGARG